MTMKDGRLRWRIGKQYMNNIRLLTPSDIPFMVIAFSNIGWNKPTSLFEKYLKEQIEGTKWVWVAFHNGEFAGYVTLELRSEYLSFSQKSIPEIKDLNVLPHFRNQGIGSALLDCAEAKAQSYSAFIGIGVGLYADYGNAQKLYIKRGYIPDGNGVTYHYQSINPGKQVILDDDLVLWFTKKL